MNKKIFLLPGLKKQFDFLAGRINLPDLKILVIGAGTADIANLLYDHSKQPVDIIVEDYDTLMNTKLELDNSPNVIAKLMDFERTDYHANSFDLVYVQGSISNLRRTKIIKEIKRILKSESFLCVGEVVKLEEEIPIFVKELYDYSNLDPIYINKVDSFYEERNFELIDSADLSNSLNDYYTLSIKLLEKKGKSLSPNEKSYYKKLLNQIKHESNTYLKLGGKKFMGFKTILLKKK